MTLLAPARTRSPEWSSTKGRLVILAVHLVLLAIGPITTSFGIAGEPASGPAGIAIPLGLAVLGLQLRHSFAIAQGRRPRGVAFTVLALALLVYLPLFWFGWSWASLQVCLITSLPIVLRGWPLATAIAIPILATDWAVVRTNSQQPLNMIFYWVVYETFTLVVFSAALYTSARLVRVVAELHAARAELAELEVGRERLRVSRDLHDLLGQSLSAVSLKGQLALRLLPSDVPAARAEVEGLTGVARDALRGVRAITRHEHVVSLEAEAAGAAELLRAADIDVHARIALPELSPAVEEVLAWAVREGVTNVLRHSDARTCLITAGCWDGRVRLEMVNDGAHPLSGGGKGLAGLSERARALSGSVSAGPAPDGRFRLTVELPWEAT